MAKLRVVLEVAPKRSFASAIDWPGWSRGAKTEDEALDALLAYAPRYAVVAKRAKAAFRPPKTERGVEVVQRQKGGSGTEFGVPGVAAAAEREPISAADLERLIALLRASWATFDAAAKAAEGVSLSLGPRGGGRQVPKMIEHVREAEAAYAHQLGTKAPRERQHGRPAQGVRRGAHRARHRRAGARTRTRCTGRGCPATRSGARPGTRWTTPGRSRTARRSRPYQIGDQPGVERRSARSPSEISAQGRHAARADTARRVQRSQPM